MITSIFYPLYYIKIHKENFQNDGDWIHNIFLNKDFLMIK
jgi:hypothetical protein